MLTLSGRIDWGQVAAKVRLLSLYVLCGGLKIIKHTTQVDQTA